MTKSRPSRRIVALVIALVVLSGAVAAALVVQRGGPDDAVEVQALWYGIDTAGNVQGGVTPVTIMAGLDDPATPLSIDLASLTEAGAGPMWTAATATAGTQAVLATGVDPRRGQINYALTEAIDGPSAGALLTVGSLAAIRSATLSPTTTMTGTVLADGSVGPVGGVPEKIRAAVAAGFTRVLVPYLQREAADPASGAMVDVVELGSSLGIEVVPVRTVAEAYDLMTGTPAAGDALGRPPLDPDIDALLARRARTLNASTSSRLTTLYLRYIAGTQGPDADAESLRITGLMRASDAALAQDDSVLAFTAAAEAAQEVSLWGASARLQDVAASASLPQLVASVRADAQQLHDSLMRDIPALAETPVDKVEQVPALADAVSWGDASLAVAEVALTRLESVESLEELDQIVRFLEVGRFEAATYMRTSIEALSHIGNVPLLEVEGAVGLMAAYADLLAYAAEANLAYVRSTGLADPDGSYIDQLTDEGFARMRDAATLFPDVSGPTAKAVLRLSAALEQFVVTAYQVNTLTNDQGILDAPPNLLPIANSAEFDTQAQVADETATAQMEAISAAGLDPSYVRWNSQWGANLSMRRLPDTSDQEALHGLEDQWFSVLQSRLLMALANARTANPS